MTQFTLITIDLDDTLWPCSPVIRRAEQAHYAWLQREAATLTEAHDIAALREHRRRLMARRPELAHDFTALRAASLCALLQELGHPEDLARELAEAATEVFLTARNQVEPYPDAPVALDRLRQAYTLASVTNGNADVHRTPLRTHFHFALTAAGVGVAKPAPDMFLRALERAGVKPRQAVHVGDDPELDVEAARRVGMGTVWVNRSGAPWPAHIEPADAAVGDLHGLVEWLLGRNRCGAAPAAQSNQQTR